ncbi:MAG: S-layer homology domain-containing protein [Candidatus Gracilibacteria bacterium]
MKKLLASLVLSLVVFVTSAQADFSDVSTAHTHYAAIMSLVEQGILEGYADGTFLPGKEVNRAEALKIILLGTGVEVTGESTAGILFSDVSEGDWFFDYVSTAVSLGIIQGYDDGTFKPEQTVNRAEAIKMLLAAAGLETSMPTSAAFLDTPVTEWFSGYATYAKTWNIQPPQTDGLWHPEEAITRANLAEMVYRFQETESLGHAFDEGANWQRKEFPTVDITMKVPFSWGYKQEGVGAIFLLDRANDQMSLLTPYDNGATLLLTRYANSDGKSSADLFASIKENTLWETEESTVNGYAALVVYHDAGIYYREWYVMLDNGSLLHAVALRGDGAYSPYLEWFFETMVASIEYDASTTSELTIEQTVAELREAIQVDGVGAEMMDLLADWELIETDTIGVGTGPVDYYYSPSANVTVKYERSFDVILDLEDGETSAF